MSWAGGASIEFTTAEEQTKRRTTVWIAVAAVVAVLLAVGGYFLFSGDAKPKPVALPDSFAGYTRMTSAAARQAETAMRTGLSRRADGSQKDAIDAAGVGVYARGSTGLPELIVLAFPTSALHESGAPYEITDEMFSYLHPVNREYPAGAHGGSVRCGPIRSEATRIVACAWSDATTTGLAYAVPPATKPADLANTVNELRAAVD
jgi:hypothetical protein